MPTMSDKTRMDAAWGIRFVEASEGNRMRHRIIGGLGLLIVVVATAWGIVTRFQNPMLTETQLFLEFWDRWLTIAIASVVGVFTANVFWK